MYSDKDDNDNEQKNIDTYKILGDQMARLALNTGEMENDENNYLITYDDLASKVNNINPNPILKTASMEKKNKGSVKFSQGIKAGPSSSKIVNKSVNKNKSNKNFNKSKTDNKNDSEKKLPCVNSLVNPVFKNSNSNLLANSITNTNTNSCREKNNLNLNYPNNTNNTNILNNIISSNNDTNKNINPFKSSISNPNNNVIVTNTNQTNFLSNNYSLKPSSKNNNSNTVNSIRPSNINTNINKQNTNNNYMSRGNNFPTSNNINSNSRSNNSNLNNIDSKNNETLNSEDLEPIEIEIVNPEDFESEKSSLSFQNPFQLGQKISKHKHLTLYEREMKNLKKKRNKLDKERKLIIQKKMNYLQPGPVINDASHNMIAKMGEYIPIQDRAAQIHSKHLTQIILNEELNRIEKQNKEDKEMQDFKKNHKVRKYEKEKWDNFVESTLKWQEEVNYKRRAAEIYRNNLDKKENYKPKINLRSKQLMKKIKKGNNSVDDVFIRLYNDYEEHKERQKILDMENLPPFYPKINKVKFFSRYINNKNSSANNSVDRFITDNRRNNFFLESQMKVNGNKLDTHKTNKTKHFKNVNKFVNKNENKIKKYNGQSNVNKSYRPTLATNNSTILLNTEGNTMGFSRYITTENPLFTETNQYYIPTKSNINYFSDDKIEEISEINFNQNKNNNNYFAYINEDDEPNINYNNNKNISNKNHFILKTNFEENPEYNNKYINNEKNLYSNNYNNYIYTENNNTNYINNNDSNLHQNRNNNYIYNEINHNDSYNENIQNNNINLNNSNKINPNNNYNKNRNKKINNNLINEYENLKNKSRNKNEKNKQNTISKKDTNSKIPKSLETYEINNTENFKTKKNDIYNPKINENKKTHSEQSNMNCCIGKEEMFRDEEILQELKEAQLKTKERLEQNKEKENKDYDNENNEDNLYMLNVRDTTPENMKENIVIPNGKYSNFFDIEGITEL